MMILFNIFQAVGFYGFANWVPTLLIAQGIEVTRSLEYTFIIAMAAPFGPLLGALLADRFERKYLLASVALGVGVFGLFFSQMRVAALLILFGVLVTLSNNAMSFLYHAYQAEVYPTRIRALAVGFVYSWSRLSTVFSAFVIAFILGNFGAPGRVHLHRRQHADRRAVDPAPRAQGQPPLPRSDFALRPAGEALTLLNVSGGEPHRSAPSGEPARADARIALQ